MQFDRFAELVGLRPNGDQITSSGLRTSFRIRKSIDPEANTLDVTVYNMSESTRSFFESTDTTISLAAGYTQDEIRIVGVGDISKYLTTPQRPDITTQLVAGDGLRALRDTRVSLSFGPGVSARTVIEAIASQLRLSRRAIDADLSGSYRNGFSYVGPAKEALNRVTKRFDLEWSIQNGDLQILRYRDISPRQAVLLSPQTGLLDAPRPVDDISSGTSATKVQSGYVIRSFLNPLIEPGVPIVVRSSKLDDVVLKPITVEHDGDTKGPSWYTTVEAVEV